MNEVTKLEEQIKEENKKIKENSPFKKGDCVMYEEELCRVTDAYGYKGELVVMLQNNNTRSLGWSSNTHYVKESDVEKIKKVKEPKLDVENIYTSIRDLKNERDEMVKEIDKKISSEEQRLAEEQSKCAHIWDEGYETGKTIQHMVGETEQKEYECEICGIVAYNT